MSYPKSSPVAAGDATEASQYNDLRSDALYLGGDPAGSGNLLQLLYQSMGQISLTRASATTIRLNASSASPCGVMISGGIFAVTADLTILLTSVSLSTAGRCYLFAVAQSDGTFILDASYNTVISNGRMIGTFLWDGYGIIPGTLHNMTEWEAIRAVVKPSIANGRLTLAAGIPVSETDITMAETVYFTPFNGNEIALFTGGEWEVFSFGELSLPLSGMTNGLPYDLFLSANRDGLSLSMMPWGSPSARLTTLIYHDGVKVSAADRGKRYLGTIALNAAGYGEDSATGRLLWNENNRVNRPMLSKLTQSGTGTSEQNKWVPFFYDKAPEVALLVPDPDTDFELTGVGKSSYIDSTNAGYSRMMAIGICQEMNKVSPWSDNSTCVPVFTESYGNTPMTVSIRNYDATFRGYHVYTLAFYTNYTFSMTGPTFSSIGAGPGLFGVIRG